MNWEKQDNELRSLMTGTDFLPDGETWNTRESWKKLQLKQQPTRRRIMPVWVRLAAAACVAGLLGGGAWYFLSTHSVTNPGKELAGQQNNQPWESANKSNGLVEVSGEKPLLGQVVEDTRIVQRKNPSVIIDHENANERPNAGQTGKRSAIKTVGNNEPIKASENDLIVAIPTKEPGKIVDGGEAILPDETLPQPLVMLPAPAIKKKPRVVHYNQLSGSASTAPPVFVQTKKEPAEWETMGWQASNIRKDPSMQLKIDISPAPKKSL